MIIRAGVFMFLQLLSGVLIFSALVMVGFGLRDGFCYPDYIRNLSASIALVTFVAAVVLTPGALIAGWTLGEMRRRWSFVMVPHGLTFLSLGGLYGADALMRLANEAHCAQGRPEIQDNTVQTNIISEALTYLSAASAFGALLACGVIVLRMLTVANDRKAT
ncbi:MAG: hypothetical protein HKO95_12200 [Rhodobacteraceae bacterium]|nr:hypothetical protein [Alphaproteobacteria bacterium]NNK67484.1 hypothetical protein [Paracoccaceae bacterium]